MRWTNDAHDYFYLNDIFEFLSDEQILLIRGASGKTGQAGRQYTKKLREAKIIVDWENAVEIFNEFIIRKQCNLIVNTLFIIG